MVAALGVTAWGAQNDGASACELGTRAAGSIASWCPNFPLATNGGLTRGDVLAAAVAAAHRGVNDERLTGARVSLLIKPSDALTITPGIFYQRIGQGGENAYDSDPGPPAHYQLGRLLFIRHSGGISLTDSGVLLYQHAEHVLKGMQRLTDEMAADSQVPRGLVSMGAPPSMQSTLTAPVAARFIKAFPHAFLNVIQDTSARLREGVAAGHLDVIVVSSMAPSGGLHYAPLFTESLCLIYAASSPLHMKTHARLEDMLGIPLILCGYPDTLRLYLKPGLRRFRTETYGALRSQFRGAGRRFGCARRRSRYRTLRVHPTTEPTALGGHPHSRPRSLMDDRHFLRTHRVDRRAATEHVDRRPCAARGGQRRSADGAIRRRRDIGSRAATVATARVAGIGGGCGSHFESLRSSQLCRAIRPSHSRHTGSGENLAEHGGFSRDDSHPTQPRAVMGSRLGRI